MAHLLVWGNTREILAGDLPAGHHGEEVRSPRRPRRPPSRPGRGARASPTLAPRGRARGARGLVPRRAARPRPCSSAVADPGDARRGPAAACPSSTTCSSGRSRRRRLRRARARARRHQRPARRSSSSTSALSRKSQELHELNKIGVALSAERDINKLLELILGKSREITAADAGSLYLVERGEEPEATATTTV